MRDARLALTFAFMAVNGMLMHGLRRTENGHFFWITQPLKCKSVYEKFYEASPTMDRIAPVARSQIKGCDHEHNCDSYIMEVSEETAIDLCRKLYRVTINGLPHSKRVFVNISHSALVWRLHEALYLMAAW